MFEHLTDFQKFLIYQTRDYIAKAQGDPSIDFSVWFDEGEGVYKAKFSYGRAGSGNLNEAVCGAIAQALTAIDEDA